MNMILLSSNELSPDGRGAVLTGRRHEHILTILKSSAGDKLWVGIKDGKLGQAAVKSIDELKVDLEDISLTLDPPQPSNVTLVLALPRPLVIKRILRSVTSLGVKKIFLIGSNRVEKSYWKSPVLQDECIKEQLILGLEQAKDTVMPEVFLRPLFKTFIEDELGLVSGGSKIFLAHPGKKNVPAGYEGQVTLIIGPEGGFVPYEVDMFSEKGARTISSGERILKVETAVTAFISLFSL